MIVPAVAHGSRIAGRVSPGTTSSAQSRAQVPASIDLQFLMDRSKGVREAVHDVQETLLIAMALGLTLAAGVVQVYAGNSQAARASPMPASRR